LVLSRNYPNDVMPVLGLWVEGLVRHCARQCEVRVVAPVPYCPPLPALSENYTRLRRVPTQEIRDDIPVVHPRFLLPPGYAFHGLESIPYYLAAVRSIDRLRKEFDFDLIHAHFSFPDGWAAACLGRRYGVPVLITEQAPWRPWMDDYKLVRLQALWAARQSRFHIAISRSVRDEIVHFAGESERLRVIPDGVDTSVFTLARNGVRRIPNQILFVGAVRPVKGADILLRAMRLLQDRGRELKLVLVGDPYYGAYRKEYDRLRVLASELGLQADVEFAGRKSQEELVRYMQQSAVLVLPSRKESLGMVLAEALACGTPVVATRCGGPEDIVNENVGVLAPPGDAEALASGIAHVIDNHYRYIPEELRAYAVEHFDWEQIAARVMELYAEAVENHG
jgi:glycosyltransferase involved in cell wall biosynthesis